jgi:4-amino-4-deoxy-L-arabinose transferase-like glycosyltransferase
MAMARVVAGERRQVESRLVWLPRVLVAAALVVFIGYLAVYTYYAIRLFQFPFDYDQGEGYELVDTILLSRGEWPYRDIESYPFYSSNYPPIYHLVVVPLVWLFGPHYWTGRLVTYLATLVTAAAIGYAVYSAEGVRRRWWLAALAGLAYLASNYVYHVGPLFRQHLFMVMLETLAVVLVARVMAREEADGRPRWPGLLLVMVLLLAAGYTKQLAYATIAAIFIFLFLRRPLRAVVWTIGFLVVTALVFVGINLATDGHWLTNTVTANINEFIPGQATGLLRQWFNLHTMLAVVAGLYALFQLYAERLSVYSIWFVVTLINSLTAGKWGAGESYFVTTVAASCILTALAFGRLLDQTSSRRALHALAASAVALLFLWQASRVVHLPTHTPLLANIARALGHEPVAMVAPQTSCSAPRPPQPVPYVDSAGVSLLGRPPTAADTEAGKRIVARILAGETAAFSEEAGFNLYAGRDVVTNPTQLLNLYKNDAVDLTEMLAMLDNREFDTVILRAQFYPPPVLEAIGRGYETAELIEMNGFVYCILERR